MSRMGAFRGEESGVEGIAAGPDSCHLPPLARGLQLSDILRENAKGAKTRKKAGKDKKGVRCSPTFALSLSRFRCFRAFAQNAGKLSDTAPAAVAEARRENRTACGGPPWDQAAR